MKLANLKTVNYLLPVVTAVVLMLWTQPVWGQSSEWQPADSPMMSRWAAEVDPAEPLPEYPRPQMQREEWKNLNGLWSYAISPAFTGKPESWDGDILVPYPVESALSGVKKRVGPDQKLWYKTTFEVPEDWRSDRLILHFGAVDWRASVWVNGKKTAIHEGGYTAFSVDVTTALKEEGKQELVVEVWDPSDAGFQPRGKQVREPKGIWYTPTTGIWQTVWLEPVPDVSIDDLKMQPNIDEGYLSLNVRAPGAGTDYTVRAVASDGVRPVGEVTGKPGEALRLPVENPELWSPDNPFLYDLKVELIADGEAVDQVSGYFGMREIRLGTGEDGYTRLFLNDKPLFHYGLLDQGFWPGGLYTAPTDEALRYDIQATKDLGFNMIRKHVKVEPARWYYWADKIGVMVWQDMPNGDKHIRRNEEDIERVAQSEFSFKSEIQEMIRQFYNAPSIVAWVPFNEGWGQFDTPAVADFVRNLDPTRLIDIPSGWQDRGVGDMHDIHKYPGPAMPPTEENRASVLGEFGGQAYAIEEHMWVEDLELAPGHIRTSTTLEGLQEQYREYVKGLFPLKKKGLAGAVYTQTTDVESEVNGMMTYDRAIVKFDSVALKKLHQRLIENDPESN